MPLAEILIGEMKLMVLVFVTSFVLSLFVCFIQGSVFVQPHPSPLFLKVFAFFTCAGEFSSLSLIVSHLDFVGIWSVALISLFGGNAARRS